VYLPFSKKDFKELPWDVLMLLAGGMVLGDAMSDQLLCLVANILTNVVKDQSLWYAPKNHQFLN